MVDIIIKAEINSNFLFQTHRKNKEEMEWRMIIIHLPGWPRPCWCCSPCWPPCRCWAPSPPARARPPSAPRGTPSVFQRWGVRGRAHEGSWRWHNHKEGPLILGPSPARIRLIGLLHLRHYLLSYYVEHSTVSRCEIGTATQRSKGMGGLFSVDS